MIEQDLVIPQDPPEITTDEDIATFMLEREVSQDGDDWINSEVRVIDSTPANLLHSSDGLIAIDIHILPL
ncbi:MAG: hypothetical protein AAF191_14465 [Verrucomicrobiota bacterium]